MENQKVRKAARAALVPLWKVAAEMGISEATLTRWLRNPLPEEKERAALDAIKKIECEV